MSRHSSAPDPHRLFEDARPGDVLAFLLSAVIAIPLGAFVLTQRIAFRLGFPPELGPPLVLPVFPPWAYLAAGGVAVALGGLLVARRLRVLVPFLIPFVAFAVSLAFGPAYPPFRGLRWILPCLRSRAGRALLGDAVVWAAAGVVLTLGVGALLAKLGRSRREVAEVALGSSRPATEEEVRRAGLFGSTGFQLGVWKSGLRTVPLVDGSEDHVLLMMPSGAGKTSGPILSTLLTRTENAFILDPKGELWEKSAGWRRSMGHRCLLFAPSSPRTLRWNCLAEIERGPGEGGDLHAIAVNLVSHPASVSGEDHWIQSARSLFYMVALHALYAEENPTLPSVRALLSSTEKNLERFLEGLLAYEHDPTLARGFRSRATGEKTATHPEVALLARRFLDTPHKERGSILSTLQTFLAIWGDERVEVATKGSDFSVRSLVEGAEPISLYVSVPYSRLDRVSPLLRVLFALLVERLMEDGAGPRRRPVDVFLDEFASLGRVPSVETMLSFFRGYGLRALLAVQDLHQIHRNYSSLESITGTCQIHVAAATQSTATRGHVSKLSGEATVRYERTSVSGGRHSMVKGRATVSPTESRRSLLTEGEAGLLHPDQLVIFKAGLQPVFAWKAPFFRDRELRRRAAIPPPPVETGGKSLDQETVAGGALASVAAGVEEAER